MNTIGKILVLLNLVMAIVTGVFLVMSFSLRSKLDASYQALLREVKVLEAERTTSLKGINNLANDVKARQIENDNLKQKLKDIEIAAQETETANRLKIDALLFDMKTKDLSLLEAAKTKQTLVDEIAVLNQTIKDREGQIVKLSADATALRVIAVNNEALAKTQQQRNEFLNEEVRRLTAMIARLESGAKSVDAGVIAGTGLNPPTVKVKGKIDRVHAEDATLVEISLGTDHGVQKNNTLDVYRFYPEPKYLGTIRIVDAYPHRSVARLMNAGGNAAARPQLKQGDEVASSILR
jgi:hypothetical protein